MWAISILEAHLQLRDHIMKTKADIATYLTNAIHRSGKSKIQIAAEAGFPQPQHHLDAQDWPDTSANGHDSGVGEGFGDRCEDLARRMSGCIPSGVASSDFSTGTQHAYLARWAVSHSRT
jgi:hypothetical protein